MTRNIVVFDIETKQTFDDVGGKHHLEQLGISVLGAYDYATDRYAVFEEKNLREFEQWLARKPALVGFNSKKFDLPILRPYLQFDPTKLPHIDMLEQITTTLGHRVSLDSVAAATLGQKKSGHGLDAIRYYQNGEIEKLKSYCLDDVKLTRQIFEYGACHQEIFYTSKFGKEKARCPVTWTLDIGLDQSDQLALF